MKTDEFAFVTARDLRIGLYIDLELGWMAHPFASSRFKISHAQQIADLRGLAVDRFRYVPALSDPPAAVPESAPGVQQDPISVPPMSPRASPEQLLASQRSSLAHCERRFSESAAQYGLVMAKLHSKPREAADTSRVLVSALADDIQNHGEAALRLLVDGAGDKAALHPVNVTVVAMLLGHAMDVRGPALQDLGLAALLHDMGKNELPERIRRMDSAFSAPERAAYQSHVAEGVRLAQHMALSPAAIQAIAHHHELADGSGFPHHIKLQAMGLGARILALVNRYDGLCNPAKASAAMTPHEALALIFSQQKNQYDSAVLSAFVRMVGVYPPGSVVQLNDERHALVVSVNAARPLKPCVLVHMPGVPRHEALVLDLESEPHASIRRSIKPASLPAAALDYLQPRQRICYFVEAAANAASLVVSA